MNRFYGIIIVAIGILIIILSILKVVPLISTGSALIFLGLLLFGLSFILKPEKDDIPRMSTAKSLVAIFYAPSEVFRNLRKHPRWLIVLLITALISSIYINAFYYKLTPERIANYTIDKTLTMSMIANNAEALKKVEEGRPQAIADAQNPIIRVGQSINGFVGLFFGCVCVG